MNAELTAKNKLQIFFLFFAKYTTNFFRLMLITSSSSELVYIEVQAVVQGPCRDVPIHTQLIHLQ